MTTDERIDKLTERHEALAQSMEMMVMENRQLSALVRQVTETVRALSRVAELHQHRIDSQDDRLDKLEGAA